MWWSDPLREIIHALFNRVLAPYIENLDLNQLNLGIMAGKLKLDNLRLKKEALDKFRLPIDVREGYLGSFEVHFSWKNLTDKPVEIIIENVYLLAVPTSQTQVDPVEDEQRALAVKKERLQNAEILYLRGQDEITDEPQKQQGLITSLKTKVLSNIQITVKNVHVRYEDKESCPGHPFAAGITLASFNAISVDENWLPAFIESIKGRVNKLTKLESLALYFDTDSKTLAGLPLEQAMKMFSSLISREDHIPDHQFILKPVSGEGRITVNPEQNSEIPKFDVQLLFNEIGMLLDDDQYRDAISLVDMYHFHLRHYQYRKYRPDQNELRENRPRALLRFAGRAILSRVHEKNRCWSWAFFEERRAHRIKYVEAFKSHIMGVTNPEVNDILEDLEKFLSYQDIRFYRSIARSQLRKDMVTRRNLQQNTPALGQEASGGWLSWIWGSSKPHPQDMKGLSGDMTDQQRRELYAAVDYDEKAALAQSFEAPRDSQKMRIVTKLQRGSFALRSQPHAITGPKDVVALLFETFDAHFVQRPDNFEAGLSLGSFSVFDDTTSGSVYRQIVKVKQNGPLFQKAAHDEEQPSRNPFLFVKFESNPLDNRADNALSVRMRHMEIIYHRGYVEAIYKFFKPPESQLEFVEAILDVATETFQSLRDTTRAGLEYALETHKTIDIQMDLNAPIIIVPESVLTVDCRHMVIDAGHISIESELVDKGAVRDIRNKRHQQYGLDDFQRLESLMYDKFMVKLEDAQFLIGENFQSCSDALNAPAEMTSLHLLEKININFSVQNSIVPSAFNLTRFKMSGFLPDLQINFSDAKYKTLLKLVNIAIPRFEDEAQGTNQLPSGPVRPKADPTLRLSSGLFAEPNPEYNIEEDVEAKHQAGVIKIQNYHQRIFELEFRVDKLQVSLFRSSEVDRRLGMVTLRHFELALSKRAHDLQISIHLRSLCVDILRSTEEQLRILSSNHNDAPGDQDLLTVKYISAEKNSPEFESTFESIDQDVDISMSTVLFQLAPEPLIAIYDFIMSTFVEEKNSGHRDKTIVQQPVAPRMTQDSTGKARVIRVSLTLEGINISLTDGRHCIASSSLSTARAVAVLRGDTMLITARLGNLSITDASISSEMRSDRKELLSIEGDNFAELRYETFDLSAADFPGFESSVELRSASIKLNFLELPLHDIYCLLLRFAKLKGLYDAASQVAVQRASKISRMKFVVAIQSPIIVFPMDASIPEDALILRLGKLAGENRYSDDKNCMEISLSGIQLQSTLYRKDSKSTSKIIDDVGMDIHIQQSAPLGQRFSVQETPTTISITVSDVNLLLTQSQYDMIMRTVNSVPKIFAPMSDNQHLAQKRRSAFAAADSLELNEGDSTTNLAPELSLSPLSDKPIQQTLDMVMTMNMIELQLFDSQAFFESDYKERGIARFALSQNSLRLKTLSDGAMEAEVILKSFTVENTRIGVSRFREIIPAAQHDRNQFMLLYTMAGGPTPTTMVIMTVDSPNMIFAMDPVFSLLHFFTSSREADETGVASQINSTQDTGPSHLDFRLDLHDVSISILESDSDPATQAIELTIGQMFMSQQGIMAVSINQLGMSLIRMDNSSERVRFLDDLDVNLAMDSRHSSSQEETSIELNSGSIVLRASYRDINLITSIANRALELSQSSRAKVNAEGSQRPLQSRLDLSSTNKRYVDARNVFNGEPQVIMSKERLKASVNGFRLVLIGDLHELPVMHFETKPFDLRIEDWTRGLDATTMIAVNINYWNLTNSHWEPLIDPWAFSVAVTKESSSSGVVVKLDSTERLDVNLSATFVELVIAMATAWNIEGDHLLRRARGGVAPYQIRNLTGGTLNVWSDFDGSQSTKHTATVKLLPGETVDWRFDDWKTMREQSLATGRNSIGVQFVGKEWEQLRSVGVDTVGEFVYSLRPRMDKTSHRLLCEVTIQGSIKIVTLRSTYKVVNLTMYPMEITLVDDSGQPVYAVEKLAPLKDYAVPIEATLRNCIRIRPDHGFKFKWSPSLCWEELMSKPAQVVKCSHSDPSEASFRFQTSVMYDAHDPVCQKYPKMTVELRAPLELENLLPYDLKYRIYDKDADQNWTSYLRRGGRMPIHAVDLRHLILLNITVQDSVFKPSDFAIINVDRDSDFEPESRILLPDSAGRKLALHLRYERNQKSGGAFKLQIFSPYIILNKTGLPYFIRWLRSGSPREVAGEDKREELAKPIPFMLSHPQDGKMFVVNIDGKGWSEPLEFETHAAEMELVIKSRSEKTSVHIGLSWAEGPGKYRLTKVITLAPRFLIKNSFSKPICFREYGVPPVGYTTIEPTNTAPLHLIHHADQKLLTCAFTGSSNQWTAPINIEDIGTVHFRMQVPNTPGRDPRLMRAEVAIEGATIFVVISEEQGPWPFLIENISDFYISFYQMDLSKEDLSQPQTRSHYSIVPQSSLKYAWDFPAAADKKIRVIINKQSRSIDLMEMGDLLPFKFSTPNGSRAVSLDIKADGPTQVLTISNYSEERSLYKLRSRGSTTNTRQASITGTDTFEAIAEEVAPSTTVNIHFKGLGISLINKDMLEIVYLSLNGLKFEYTNSSVAKAITVAVEILQIDNQLHEGIYPVVLQPTPVPQQAKKNGSPPCLQASIILLNDEEHGVLFVKYASILLQAMTIQIDEDFIYAIYDLTKLRGVSWTEEERDDIGTVLELPQNISEPRTRKAGEDIYFEVLELQPIQVSFSFVRTERVSTDAKISSKNPIAFIINAVTMAVGNINNAPLRLNALGIKDVRLKVPDLQERILYHYRQDIVRQVYRVLGSADVLGNPVGLFNNVSSGVADIFYEPFNGVVMHGNKELGIGIAKGAASFVKKTVFGFSDSLTKVTGSVGKGLSAATFDSEYQNRRRIAQRRNRPRHAIYGVTAGAEAFATSVASGVEGVVMKPIEGAEEGGAVGFLKGVGKGLVGAVTKPVVGVFDLASNLSEGIRNTTTVFDAPDRDRVRLPRAIPYDGILKPYNHREALGQSWLMDLERGSYRNERYVAHLTMPESDNVVLLTQTRILSVHSRKSTLDWDLPFSRLSGVQIEDTGVRFADRAGRQHDKFVRCPDKTTQGWFFSSVAKVVKSYNAQRRIEG